MTPSIPVVVLGASGGLGASTVALALGRRLSASGPAGLVVDLDLDGGGLDVTAGVEHLPGRRWPAFAEVRGDVEAPGLVESLPGEDGCRVLSAGGPSAGPVPARAVRDVLGSLLSLPGPLVVDAGRAALPSVVLRRQPVVLVLVGLRTRALADADARLEALHDAARSAGSVPDLRLVTRGGRPSRDVVDDVVAHLGVAHLAHLPDDARAARAGERGLWPGSGRDAVRAVADHLVRIVGTLRVPS